MMYATKAVKTMSEFNAFDKNRINQKVTSGLIIV